MALKLRVCIFLVSKNILIQKKKPTEKTLLGKDPKPCILYTMLKLFNFKTKCFTTSFPKINAFLISIEKNLHSMTTY